MFQIDTPWKFRDKDLENEYQADSIRDTIKRALFPGTIFVFGAWILRLPLLWSLCFGMYELTLEEMYATWTRMGLLLIYTLLLIILHTDCLGARIKKFYRPLGYFLVWINRFAAFPTDLIQEVGVPQHSTQLFVMQVNFYRNQFVY